MLGRFTAAIVLLSALGLAWRLAGDSAHAIERQQQSVAGRVATLQQQLEKRLRTTRPDQKDYIASIVNLVNQKKLTLREVQITADYAVKRRADFPFPYFEQATKRLVARKSQ